MKKRLINSIALCLIGANVLLPIKDVNIINFSKDNNIETVVNIPDYDDSMFVELVSEDLIVEELVVEDLIVDYLEGTSYINEYGQAVITNVDDILVLVNKKRNLPSNYKPKDLVIPKVKFSFNGTHDKKHLRKEAASALEELFLGAQEENITLYAVSGYRSYSTQKGLFDRKANAVGAEKANLLVAKPGQSEHHTGLAMDISAKSINFVLEEYFKDTAEGIWLKTNAHKYGFIIRYQEDTTETTGYSYEPWHVRYVGKEIAAQIYEENITLEEFLGDI